MGGSSKTTSENSPPSWAAPLFKQSADEANKLYNSGAGGNAYMGSTVSPLSGTTMQGVNQLAQAGGNWRTDQTRPIYQQLGAAATGPSAADKYLTDTASGAYLQEGNPYYRERLDKEVADSNAMIRSTFSGMGRSGSGVDQRAVAENTGNMMLQGLENDWNRERANQLQATGMIDQSRLAGLGLGLQSADSMKGLDQQQFQNRLTGAGATLQAGGILDTQAQKQLTDEVNKWYGVDNQDWTRLGMLQSAAGGAAGPYGTQTAATRQSPGIGQILGAAGGLLAGK